MADSSPRFRIRFEDGSELPIDSVEGLARRLTRGDILPDTEIFDAGTGGWGSAASSPVVRFILDELERDGFLLPTEWETAFSLDVGAPSAERGLDPEVPDPVDPLDLKLTVSPDVDVPEEERPDATTDDGDSEPDAPSDRHWVTPSSDGGLLAKESVAEPGEVQEGTPGDRDGLDQYLEDRRARRRRRRWVSIALAAAATLVVLWGVSRWGSGADAPIEAPLAGGAQEVSVPEGLEEVTELAVSRLSGRMLAVADSVRAAHGLARTPPDGWLSGRYLAGADSFPAVRPYWETYGEFLEDLRSIDSEQMRTYLAEARVDGADGRQDELEAYMEARREAAGPRREDLFDQLERATQEALALHDYLVAETALIRYTPAVGTNQVPRDPVLEIASDSAAILETLGDRMDALFDALDRSRGGGAPEMSGLGTDLFRGFGLF